MTTQSTVGERLAKNALFDGFASVAGALANGRRAEIIELLAQARETSNRSPTPSTKASQTPLTTSAGSPGLDSSTLAETADGSTTTSQTSAYTNYGLRSATSQRGISRTSSNSPAPTSETAPRSRPLLGVTSKHGCNTTRRPSSTCGLEPNTTPDTSLEPSRSHLTNSTSCSHCCPRIGRSSPTAEAHTACTPTRPCARSSPKDERPGGSKMGTPNGNAAAAPSRRATPNTRRCCLRVRAAQKEPVVGRVRTLGTCS